jgi:hypothetical protein
VTTRDRMITKIKPRRGTIYHAACREALRLQDGVARFATMADQLSGHQTNCVHVALIYAVSPKGRGADIHAQLPRPEHALRTDQATSGRGCNPAHYSLTSPYVCGPHRQAALHFRVTLLCLSPYLERVPCISSLPAPLLCLYVPHSCASLSTGHTKRLA